MWKGEETKQLRGGPGDRSSLKIRDIKTGQ